MDTFSPLGFDVNWSFGQQSVFTVVDSMWQQTDSPPLEMITEWGDLMITESGNFEMITE